MYVCMPHCSQYYEFKSGLISSFEGVFHIGFQSQGNARNRCTLIRQEELTKQGDLVRQNKS